MWFRHLSVICSVFFCVSAKSLTLVIDTTYSMEDEIGIIRRQMPRLIYFAENTSAIENYIIVPFNDPDVGPAQIHTKAEAFLESINSLTVAGGIDIPENSLSGLEKALQESKPESDIFLFTDACAKDESKFNDIQRLCHFTRSKVIVFMSGTCPFSEMQKYGNITTYNHVGKVCFGNLFPLDLNNYAQAFRFMRELIKDGYNDVQTLEPFSGHRSLHVPVDGLTQDVILAVSGDRPVLRVLDETRHQPPTESLIVTNQLQVTRIPGPHTGKYYQVWVESQGDTTVTTYTRTEFPLTIGFSPLYPQSIDETTTAPLPGRENFIFVLVPKPYEYKLGTLTIYYMLKNKNQQTLNLMESRVSSRIYISSKAYFEPGCIFRIEVSGVDKSSSEPVRTKSRIFEAQREVTKVSWSAAAIERIIPETSLTNYKEDAKVACKVTGFPQPTIWWEDESGQKMTSEDSLLQYPATYISYVTVTRVTDNRTITCKARTSSGEDSRSTELYVYRPYVFQMIRIPEDITIQYEADGRLYCEVNAYPDAVTTWYHNDKDIVFTTNEADDDDYSRFNELEYFKEDNALVIKNMSSRYVGTYTCDVRNGANAVSYPVEVRISGLESPVLEVPETDLTSNLGDRVEIACRVSKGKPTPSVTWQYKPVDGYDFVDVLEGTEVEEGKLTINEVMSKHKGTYKCEAVNEQGKDSREVQLRVIYAPRIENSETTKNELADANITLECKVDAEPKASVTWDRQGATLSPDEKYVMEGTSLMFVAHINDSGAYRCVAENEAGIAEKTITLNVLGEAGKPLKDGRVSLRADTSVEGIKTRFHLSTLPSNPGKPYITPVLKNRIVRAGSSLTLSCGVEDANPTPTITWEFIGHDNKIIKLYSGESMYSEYTIPRVSRAESGQYQCCAENNVGRDVYEITVNVQ